MTTGLKRDIHISTRKLISILSQKELFLFYERENIKLLNVDEVKQFVSAAIQCDFDVDVYYNRVIIDAKSILGVFSLDLRQVLTVRMYGENKEFEELLDTLAPDRKKAA